jgi:hydroxymethylglutaryl-CoA synthase
MTNTYDFYKPRLDSEYPEVDGPVSVTTYTSALDAAYSRFREKTAKAKKTQFNGHANGNGFAKEGPSFSIDDIDYAIFHSPYGKQVQKGFGRLFYNDFLANPSAPQFANIPSPDTVLETSYTASLTDKNLEKTFIGASKATYAKKVEPGMACSKRLGNMYTGSLYGCLASVLSTVSPSDLLGKRLSMFAFGSGCAASFFTLRVKGDTLEIREKMDLLARLASMKLVPCQEYVDALTVSLAFCSLECEIADRMSYSSARRTTTL